MHLSHHPFAGVVLPFCCGISLYFYQVPYSLFLSASLLPVLPLLLAVNKKHRLFLLLFACFLPAGYFIALTHDPQTQSHYVGRFQLQEIISISGYISDSPKTTKSGIRATFQVTSIQDASGTKKSQGPVMLYLSVPEQKKSTYRYGTQWQISASILPIPGPENPGQFSSAKHFRKKGITLMCRAMPEQMAFLGNAGGNFLTRYAMHLREVLLKRLHSCGYSAENHALLAALLFGYDDEVSTDTYTLYAHSGVMHIISVSGLHIGIIFMAFRFLLIWMEQKKSLKIPRLILLLSALWFYALLTGLSSPVTRACLMFSFILIGKALNRDIVPLNLLLATAWCMLIVNPFWLFHTGFQLSFLAIAGILLLNPVFDAPVQNSSQAIRLIWQAASASLSATLFTLPVCLSTFAQFAWYFIPSNLIAIPLSTLLMYGVIADVAVFSPLFHTTWLTQANTLLLLIMNGSLKFISSLPGAVTSYIHLSALSCLLIFIAVLFFTLFLHSKKRNHAFLFLFFLMSIPCTEIFKKNKSGKQKLLVFYAMKKETVFSCISGHSALIVSGNTLTKKMQTAIENCHRSFGITQSKHTPLSGHRTVSVKVKGFMPIALAYTHDIDSFSGVLLVNHKLYSCKQGKEPALLWDTKTDGACILNLNNAKNPIVSPLLENESYD
jgi:competence protein ComEC